MKTILIILQLSFISAICLAQADSGKIAIAITARGYADHIVLRYDPATPVLFSEANTAGYVLEKAVYKDGVPFEKLTYTPVKGSPFKRWSDDKWDNAIGKIDPKDTTSSNLVGLAAAFSDPGAGASGGDILKDGLKSLKDQTEKAQMVFGFALIAANRSKVAAEGLALSITDNDVTLGQTYVYRVHINQPSQNPGDAAYVKVKCENFNEAYLRNDKAIKVEEGDRKISFSFPESREYYAFDVERSDNGGASYIKISQLAKVNAKATGYTGTTVLAYSDSGLVNYKKYVYRVLVATPFADELLLAQFTAMPRDKTPPSAPFLKSTIQINAKQVELTWDMNGEKGDLKGFNVKRGNKEGGPFTLISKQMLPPGSLKYLDDGFDPQGTNYYVVEAVDTAGNKSGSFPAYVTLIDSTPPAMPVIASAIIDSLGKITIKVKPNTEKDFMGYQLLKANSKEHQFSVVLETYKDSTGRTTFTMYDSTTLNTLTKNIYYKVIAFDTHFNQSVPSAIIELKKRDTIPPISPLISDFAITDTTVVISFVNSSSEDAVSNYLLRREVGKLKYDTIFNNHNTAITRFIDRKFIGGRQYEYAMMAKDDGGLSSKISRSVILKTLLNNTIPAPTLKGAYDDKTKKVSLTFVVDDKLKNRKLQVEIYKRTDKKSVWVAYKVIDLDKTKLFLDNPANGQKGMIYTVRLTDENKNSSNFSNALELKF